MKSVISKLYIIVSYMRYIISDLLGSLDISRQMSASFNLLMTIIIIFTHSRWRKTGRTNVKSQRGCEREMFKGFFFTAFFTIPFNFTTSWVLEQCCLFWLEETFSRIPKNSDPKKM